MSMQTNVKAGSICKESVQGQYGVGADGVPEWCLLSRTSKRLAWIRWRSKQDERGLTWA
jgi:hypothetical protein